MASLNYLIVAGGGGADSGSYAGGGGGGGVLSGTDTISGGSFAIVVGGGGTLTTSPTIPAVGGDSSFNGHTASGGGPGNDGANGNSFPGGGAGGCGGGARGSGASVSGGTGSQGGNGGNNLNVSPFPPGGGGGAAPANGGNGSGSVAGSGAAGFASSISGASLTYAGGGAGGDGPGLTAGSAGACTSGFGAGASAGSSGVAGTAGVVIISYVTGTFTSATGGTITTSGGNTIHTFTANGTFTASTGQPNGSITIAGLAPTLATRVAVGAGSATFTGAAPTLSLRVPVPKGAVTITGYAPIATSGLYMTATAVWYSSDRTTGGSTVTIIGAGFDGTTTVTIDGISCAVTFISSTRIQAVTPAHAAGAVSLVVANASGYSSTLPFTYYQLDSNPTKLITDFGGATPLILDGSVNSQQNSRQGQTNFEIVPAGTRPVPFTPAKFGIGSLADRDLMFRGEVATSTAKYLSETNINWKGVAGDSSAQFNRNLVYASYNGADISVAARTLLAANAPEFTGVNIQSGLGTITLAFDGATMDAVFQAFAAAAGSYYYRDEAYDVHLFLTEVPSLTPDPIDASNTSLIAGTFSWTADTKQMRNRVSGVGQGTTVIGLTPAGSTSMAVVAAMFDNAANKVHVGSQIISYTGLGNAYTPSLDTWTDASPGGGALRGSGIAWSPTLGLFAAVGSSGAWTSPDGITWTSQSISSGTWSDVVWAPALGLFVAVDSNFGSTKVATSTDGVTWTLRTAASAGQWSAITWSSTLSLLVAVGSNAIMTSLDGINWTSRTSPVSRLWAGVVWATSLNLFVAVGSGSGTTKAMTSPDGITWTARTNSTDCTGLAWSPSLSLLVAVTNSDTTVTSTNGTSWTSHASAAPNANFWQRIIWASELGLFIAVARSSGSSTANQVMTSPDGLTWTARTSNDVGLWYGLAWAPGIGVLAATAGDSTGGATAMRSVSTIASTLTGIPATGVGAITQDIAGGTTVNLYASRNNLTSQAVVKALEGGLSTGVYEARLQSTGTFATQTALNAACDAELRLYADAGGIVTATGISLDSKIHYGRPIHIDKMALLADLQIQTVSIGNVGFATSTPPRYTWTASGVFLSFEDLLRRLIQLST